MTLALSIESLRLRSLENQTDVARLADFNAWGHRETDEADPQVSAWTRQLFNGAHPTISYDDCLLLEDAATNEIVSSLCVIPQTWTYADIPFETGRVELVGTAEEYRHQGLIRALMEHIHQRSQEQGHLVQAITGIPYYYRQFGYEFALELGAGLRLPFDRIPAQTETAPYRLRDWRTDDIPRLQTLYERLTRRQLIACPRSPELWRYFFHETDPGSVYASQLKVIGLDERIVGYVSLNAHRQGALQELAMDHNYRQALPWLLNALREAQRPDGADGPANQFNFMLGRKHPAYPFLRAYGATARTPYAWYVRVPDLATFIRRIAPILERRLIRASLPESDLSLTMSFYRSGLRLKFEAGKLLEVENLSTGPSRADYLFPPGVFLQLLFGYRSLKDLRYAYPDVTGSRDMMPTLNALFPRRPSWIRPLY